MAIWDKAVWLGPPDSNYSGSMIEVRGLVLHIAEGSYRGTINWQNNPASDVSSHFIFGLNEGERAQMLDTNVTAWTQANGNGHWVSVENAGFHYDQFTPAQIEANAQLYAWLHEVYNVPMQLTDSPSGSGLGWHGMGGASWGGHPDCPGPANVALRGTILARAQEILNGDDMTASDVWTYVYQNPPDFANPYGFNMAQITLGTNEAAYKCLGLLQDIKDMLAAGVEVPALVGLTPEALDAVETQVYNVLNGSKISANNPALGG